MSTKPMTTPVEFAESLQALVDEREEKLQQQQATYSKAYVPIEDWHSAADEILCKMLVELGFEEGVAVYRSMDKWYE